MNVIKILVVEPDKQPYVKEIKNSISEIYGFVYFPFEINEIDKNIILISSLGAKGLNDKIFKANRIYNNKIIYSNFVLIGKNIKDYTSLTEEQIKIYTDMFKLEKNWKI